jgi:hypothetical protein
VHTLALPVSDSMSSVFKGADLDAQLAVHTRQAAIQVPGSSLHSVKEVSRRASQPAWRADGRGGAGLGRAHQLQPQPHHKALCCAALRCQLQGAEPGDLSLARQRCPLLPRLLAPPPPRPLGRRR